MSRRTFGAFHPGDPWVLAAVLLLPWAFGGVELWALRTAAALIAVGAAIALWRGGWPGLGLDRRARWLLPAALLGLWAAAQLVPLPASLIARLSPSADAIYAETFPGYRGGETGDMVAQLEARALSKVPEAEGHAGPVREQTPFRPVAAGRWDGWRTLSLAPHMGGERLAWFVALLAAFLIARRAGGDRQVARSWRLALFVGFLGLAVFGLLYAAVGNGKLYWVRTTLAETRPFGPYVNPTNFAGMMELAAPWLAGHAWLAWRRARGPRSGGGPGWPMHAAASLLCLGAAVAAASRFAVLLLFIGMTLLGLVVARTWRRRALVLVVVALVAATGLFALRESTLGERVKQLVDITGGRFDEVNRIVSWRAVGEMFEDYSVTGVGFGSFREVFPRYLPSGGFRRWNQLHNDYLELLVEGGIIAGVLVLWLVFGFWRRVLRPRALISEGEPDPESWGLLIGLGLLSVHALVDFNHQIPSLALTFVTLAGLAAGRAERRIRRSETA